MTLAEVFPASDLTALLRRRSSPDEVQSVHPSQAPALIDAGWAQERTSRYRVRLRRPKPAPQYFEDRVWCLLYRMGFSLMSGQRGAMLTTAQDAGSVTNQLDVVAADEEVALALECKYASAPSRRPQFQEELAKLVQRREEFARAMRAIGPPNVRRTVGLGFFTHNAILGEQDRLRAAGAHVSLFDEAELAYYEALTAHIGHAARFQFLADMLQGRPIPGLKASFPAIRTKMGGVECFTFAATPEYLLKIAYVSHRAKGKASDVDAYQRMLSQPRLKRIAEYIEESGIFPTNIVVNLSGDAKRVRFERAEQHDDTGAGTFGWLRLDPTYRIAWVIDGQHRLYAYPRTSRAATGILSVLAFNGLPPGDQAQLFIDINAEQRKVKRSLLEELYAELHWNSDDDRERVKAVLSKAIQMLNSDPTSPLAGRIRMTDAPRTDRSCITMTALFGPLERRGLFYESIHGKKVFEGGPLWAPTMDATLTRTTRVLSAWFACVADAVPDWWEVGAGEGGGLTMNDGVAVMLGVLKSAVEAVELRSKRLARLTTEEVVYELRPFGEALGAYFGTLDREGRQSFRKLRGIQGQTRGIRLAQRGMRATLPTFEPDGLEEFIAAEEAQTGDRAKEATAAIERLLQTIVVTRLKEEFRADLMDWWYMGVPEGIRKAVRERMEGEKAQPGTEEGYFDLLHYRAIALRNWSLFQDLLGQRLGSRGGTKDTRTAWIDDVNEVRKKVAHPSRGASFSVAEVERLEGHLQWLEDRWKEWTSGAAEQVPLVEHTEDFE